jgi:adenylylsulfate kinase
MRNARKFNEWIAIGSVPDKEDIIQLKEIGYKSIIDLRDDEEKFGGYVKKNSVENGLAYISIPICRKEISNSDVITFFEAVYEKSERPIYCFSRFGKRPLALLLLFDALANHKSIICIIKKSREFGLNLAGDLPLQDFIINTFNSPHLPEIMNKIKEHSHDFDIQKKDDKAIHKIAEIKKSDREKSLGNRGFTLWFTGIPASGKTTLATAIEAYLSAHGYYTYLLDSHDIRSGLNKDLGFSNEDRTENIRRVSEVAKSFCNNRIINLVTLISPYEVDREKAKQCIGKENFIEVFLDCPIEVCETRDSKGIYNKARHMHIENFTGIDSPYEMPANPEIHLHTDKMSVDECINQIIEYLYSKNYLSH